MIQLFKDITHIWKQKPGFKIASSYLAVVLLLVLALPILPLPYAPNQLDLQYSFAKPFTWGTTASHWFGTDALGRDVLANVLYGARSALIISFPVMLLSSGLGLLIGISAGHFGNNGLKISRATIFVTLISILVTFYYGLYLPLSIAKLSLPSAFTWISLLSLLLILLSLYKVVLPLSERWQFAAAKTTIPLDYITLRVTEAFTSIPRLLLILALASFLQPSVLLLCVIFAATFWTSTARLARAETLKIQQLPYFEAAIGLGVPRWKLLTNHIFPNMLGPIIVTFTFGVAGLLTLESTLSFLGIGVPGSFVSWGRTIAGIRSNTAAWWLVVFPGIALSATVWALQTISFYLLNYFEDRNRH